MKKQKVYYCLQRTHRHYAKYMIAKRDLSFEIKLTAQLMLDSLIADWNKADFDRQINEAIDQHDVERFKEISEAKKHYAWEY
ncbi:hypothetical protein [Amphibacillus cookii]|uniref:hypothetical protein n=1 Tax=Amphibacillus cookii TaxID=767787 RepID=UPI001956A464|nr:hypothetical protein [Amphibacillus cookii]MBM7540082.1 uncharacterized protein YpiB (UPF0302 family) [Amphibacillus cookii]